MAPPAAAAVLLLSLSIRELNDEVPENVSHLGKFESSRHLYQVSTTGGECAKQNAFQTGTNQISDGAWCVERFHDRPFKILWRMKHTV